MKNITQVKPYINEQELSLIENTINDSWLTEGQYSKKLLDDFKALTNAKFALPVPNGTLGLYLALLSLNLPKGSEVLVPSFTFFGSVSSIHFAGLVPRFVDVDLTDYMASADSFRSAITPETSAIMPIHIYGASADMDPILDLATENGLKVIEDAAQAVGVCYRDTHCGTFGDVGVFSFFADKTITMGEGGIVTTNDEILYNRLKLIRNQGRPNSGTFVHPEFGMNFRITDIQAAIGVAQLQKLDDIKQHKTSLLQMYSERLRANDCITAMQPKQYSNYVPFRFAFTSPIKDEIQLALSTNGVQTREFFYPMHLQPAVKAMYPIQKKEAFPNSELLNKQGLCLPTHLGITEDDVEYMCDIINQVCKC